MRFEAQPQPRRLRAAVAVQRGQAAPERLEQLTVDLPGVGPAARHPDHGLGLRARIALGAAIGGGVVPFGLAHLARGVAEVTAPQQPAELGPVRPDGRTPVPLRRLDRPGGPLARPAPDRLRYGVGARQRCQSDQCALGVQHLVAQLGQFQGRPAAPVLHAAQEAAAAVDLAGQLTQRHAGRDAAPA